MHLCLSFDFLYNHLSNRLHACLAASLLMSRLVPVPFRPFIFLGFLAPPAGLEHYSSYVFVGLCLRPPPVIVCSPPLCCFLVAFGLQLLFFHFMVCLLICSCVISPYVLVYISSVMVPRCISGPHVFQCVSSYSLQSAHVELFSVLCCWIVRTSFHFAENFCPNSVFLVSLLWLVIVFLIVVLLCSSYGMFTFSFSCLVFWCIQFLFIKDHLTFHHCLHLGPILYISKYQEMSQNCIHPSGVSYVSKESFIFSSLFIHHHYLSFISKRETQKHNMF